MIQILVGLFRKKRVQRQPILRPAGSIFNLQEIFDGLNQKYFDSKLDIGITWFGTGRVPKTRILFGSYHLGREQIKINRLLDQDGIPRHVVEFIVYHEMLHHVLPPKMGKNGRRQIHHKAFKRREGAFAEFALAKADLKALARTLFPT